MSTSCCRRGGSMSPALRQMLDAKLRSICRLVPGAGAQQVSICTADGRVFSFWADPAAAAAAAAAADPAERAEPAAAAASTTAGEPLASSSQGQGQGRAEVGEVVATLDAALEDAQGAQAPSLQRPPGQPPTSTSVQNTRPGAKTGAKRPRGRAAKSAAAAAAAAAAAEVATKRSKDGSFVQVLGALQVAANRFANTLQVTECPILHVKGDSRLFSCYAIGSHCLALYSRPADDLAAYDTGDLDARLAASIDEIALVLDNIESL